MRFHLPALNHGVMDPAPARYMIRINGHLGATVLSAFPAMGPAPVRDPLADHLLAPQNAALLLIGYQPPQLAAVRSMDHALLVKERRLDGQDHQNRSGSRSCTRPSTSPPTGTANPPRRRRPSTGWTTCPASRRSWPSLRSGGPTAAWRPATCSPPPSSRPGHHRSPDSGAFEHERRLHASGPDPRCHALVLGVRGLPGSGTPGLGAPAGLPGMRSRRML